MKNISIWSDIKTKECPALNENLNVDVLIIGGGITGISTAYHLINSNLKIALVERNKIGFGVTSKTTGKLTYLQENLFSKLISYHGVEKAKLYLESQLEAMNLVKNIIVQNNIDCNLETVKSYLINNNDAKFQKEKETLKKVGIKYTEETDALYVDNTYVFHPLKYINALKDICLNNNIFIYENTKINKIDKFDDYFICQTANCAIKAKYVVLASHYPYFLIPFWMPLKSHIEQSYISAFNVNENGLFSSITVTKPTISQRFITDNNKTYQLTLTSSHNSAVKNNDIKNFNDLLNKNKKADYLWSNNDVMTNDALPFIGKIKNNSNLLIATGYNTWGMTNGSLAGKIIADIILNKKNKYISFFDPQRKINLGKIINLPIAIGSTAYSFIKSKLSQKKAWYSSNVRFEKRCGKNVGIYTDENQKEHIVYTICPHLKCSLQFNEVEKTWDCPCHGSRFDIDGKAIEGPSNYDISYKE